MGWLADATARANPAGGSVAAGQVQMEGAGSTLNIHQASQRAIINWESFSIANGETTNFIQPGASAAVLNRVIAGNPSSIYGTLNANGKVYLINPNGVFVGPSGVINAQSFIASTLDVPDAQFLAGGDMVFSGSSDASVVNQGTINALGGDVFLIARHVTSDGVINAPDGTVGLAAGTEVLLKPAGEERIAVRAGGEPTGRDGIVNTGTINAARAELKAAGGNVYALAINNKGTIRATGATKANGRVYLSAPGGKVVNTGRVVARSGSSGGAIKVDAGELTQEATGTLDASGEADGGEVELNASAANIQGEVLAAGGTGQGGTVNLTGDGQHFVDGLISAAGTKGGAITWTGTDLGWNRGTLDASGTAQAGGSVTFEGRALLNDGVVNVSGAEGGLFAADLEYFNNQGQVDASGTAGTGGHIAATVDTRLLQTGQGVLDASGLGGGAIELTGTDGSVVLLSGRLLADGRGGGAGGTVRVTAPTVGLLAAEIDASGAQGGGAILIGGGYQGGGDLTHAGVVQGNTGSVLRADATGDGDGGLIVLWSDQATAFSGSLSARGGAQGGNGGLMEVSSSGDLNFAGHADGGSPLGAAGTLLLDPKNITIDVTGNGQQLLYQVINPNPTQDSQTVELGRAVAIEGNLVILGAPRDSFAAENAGAAYTFNVTTGALVATLYSPTPAYGDLFGCAVGISGNVALVGAYGVKVDNYANVGAAYTFNATTGAHLRTLSFPGTAQSARYGSAVGIAGSVAVVGAPYYSFQLGYAATGAAYTYDVDTGTLLATISNPTPASYDYFGDAVAVSSNVVAIGAPLADTATYHEIGEVHTFNVVTGALIASMAPPTPASSMEFGSSVAMYGYTLVVGAPGTKSGTLYNAGEAYVYNANSGALISTLANPTPVAYDYFGDAVGITGGVAVVGAYQADVGAYANAGEAYFFNANTGVLISTISSPNPQDNGYFGYAVAASGTATVVGEYRADRDGTVDAGTAYVFETGINLLRHTLTAPITSYQGLTGFGQGDGGSALDIDGNLVIVGSPYDDTSATNSGIAYLFHTNTGALMATLYHPSPSASDFFGYGVGLSGNLAIVGASGVQVSGLYGAGEAYTFNATTGALTATLLNPSPQTYDYFGASVDISGNMAVAGAQFATSGGVASAGEAYTFNATSGSLIATLANPTSVGNDLFGFSVGVSGNTVVVGAPGAAAGSYTTSGQAYTFNGTTGALLATMSRTSPGDNDYFGCAVAIDGSTAVVGARGVENGLTDFAGEAYTYNANTGSLLAKIRTPTLSGAYNFGNAVDISGDRVIVGAYLTNIGTTSLVGAAYLFDAPSGALLATLDNPIQGPNDEFGYSVAISGDLSVVSAPFAHIQTGGKAYTNGGAVYIFSEASEFAQLPSASVTLSPEVITNVTSSGTNMVLQASNTIYVNTDLITSNPFGDGGTLTLQAGNTLSISGDIITDNGDLILIANDTVASGVINAYRDSGPAYFYMASGTSINAGTGAVTIELRDGAGKTYRNSGDITLRDITAGTITVVNNGPSAGSDIILSGTLTATGGGNSIVLAGDNFLNYKGANAVNPGPGRFLIYSSTPGDNLFGSLVSGQQALWNATYTSTPPSGVTASGNRYLFTLQPTLNVNSTSTSKTYGTDVTTAIRDDYTVSGFVTASTYGNVFTQDTAATATTGAAVVTSTGSGATAGVTASPYTLSVGLGTLSATTGYALSLNSIGQLTVNPAALNVKANNQSKTYGQALTFNGTEFTTTGLKNGETVGSATIASTGAGATAGVAGSPYTITIGGATGGSFNPNNYTISYTNGSLAVTPAALNVKANSTSKTYGQTVSFTGTEFTSTGLKNGETIGSATIASTGAGATASVAGSPYAITIGGATGGSFNPNNYTISYTNGSLTVTPAALNVKANSTSKTYGQTVTFGGTEFTTSGLQNGETIGSATIASTGAGATAGVAGSPYAITIGGATGGSFNPNNYTISYTNGSLTVTPAALTVTADSTSKTYGQTVTFTGSEFTSTGLKNGEIIGSATIASTGAGATASVAGSPYAITIGGATGGTFNPNNYTISYTNGSLTVTPAALNVKANSTSKTYGQTVTFGGTEFTSSGLQNGETIGSATIASTGAGATAGVSGSPYAITIGGAAGGSFNPNNYTISYTNGSLAVTPAALNVKANSTSKIYGQTVTFAGTEFTSSGLQNGETIGSATIASTGAGATAGVAGSPYAITIGGATGGTFNAANYTIGYVNGSLTVNPASLTVTADNASKSYGQAVSFGGTEFGVTGLQNGETIGSTTIASTGAATTAGVSGSPYAITIGGATGGTFNPANYTISYVNGALTVNPASLTVTADSTSKTYGQTVSFTGTEFSATGLQNGETIGSASIASTGAAATAGVSGSPYIITIGGAAGGTFNASNYNISYVNGALTVNPAPLTITADNASKTYGQTVSFTGTEFTTSGLQNGETIGSASIASTGAASTAGVSGSPYAITIGSATGGSFNVGNYSISYTNGSLTVTPAALTVTADSTSKTYGQTVSFSGTEFSATGLQNGETIGSASIASSGATATAGVSGSPYAITIGGATGGTFNASNYTIGYVNGSLTVNPAPLTVTADSASKTYGQTVSFSGTEFSATGLQNGETIGSASIASSGATSTAGVSGSPYAITIGGATGGTFNASNYTIGYVNGALTVNPAPLTVTADSTSKTYGQTVSFSGTEFSATGLQNGETIGSASIASTGAAATASVSGSPYAITIGGATGGTFNPANYTISYVNGVLTVTPAALTLTATDASKTYGQTLIFTGTEFTAAGLLNGDTVGSASIASTGAAAMAGVAGSPYAITIGGATGGTFNPADYTITYVNGRLSVDPAMLTVTATNALRPYGRPNPPLGGVVTGFVNGETGSVISGLGYTTTAGRRSPVGTYPIMPGGAWAANYAFTYVDGTLTVVNPLEVLSLDELLAFDLFDQTVFDYNQLHPHYRSGNRLGQPVGAPQISYRGERRQLRGILSLSSYDVRPSETREETAY